jgi:hypothetical protein
MRHLMGLPMSMPDLPSLVHRQDVVSIHPSKFIPSQMFKQLAYFHTKLTAYVIVRMLNHHIPGSRKAQSTSQALEALQANIPSIYIIHELALAFKTL